MSWNDGYERKKFEKKQAAQAEQYRLLGMNEAQIHAIYLFDLEEYRCNRIFAAHVQSIEGQERDGEESRNMLHKKYFETMICSLDLTEVDRFGWIEEIKDQALYTTLTRLTAEQKELVTLLFRDGYSQAEVAKNIYHTSVESIYRRMKRIRERITSTVFRNGGLHHA